MDSFHYENILLMKLHHVSIEISLSLLETETWYLDLLSCKQAVELLPEKWKIHGIQCLEVVISVRIARREFTVYKLIVKLDDFRIETENPALERKTLGCGSLAAA